MMSHIVFETCCGEVCESEFDAEYEKTQNNYTTVFVHPKVVADGDRKKTVKKDKNDYELLRSLRSSQAAVIYRTIP